MGVEVGGGRVRCAVVQEGVSGGGCGWDVGRMVVRPVEAEVGEGREGLVGEVVSVNWRRRALLGCHGARRRQRTGGVVVPTWHTGEEGVDGLGSWASRQWWGVDVAVVGERRASAKMEELAVPLPRRACG